MDRKLSVFALPKLLCGALFYLMLQWMAQSCLYLFDFLYAVQDKARVDRTIVWSGLKRCGGLTALTSLPQLSVHLVTYSVHAIQDCGTELDLILSGYTSKLQVLDVGVNKPFKDYMTPCHEHIRIVNASSTRMKRMNVSKWFNKSWKRVSEKSI